jgi:hypothetical protein
MMDWLVVVVGAVVLVAAAVLVMVVRFPDIYMIASKFLERFLVPDS